MTLLIANFDPVHNVQFESTSVLLHLYKLVQEDGELGGHPHPTDSSVTVVDYKTPSKSGFCQNMIKALANTAYPNDVVIHGVTSNYLIEINDLQRWHQISEYGGIVMFNPADTYQPLEIGGYKTFRLHIVYDVQECNGMGYVGYGPGGVMIGEPIEIVLLHELSHAYHYCRRDFDFSDFEVQAETDENSARAQLGYPLRDVNDHDGRCREANESPSGMKPPFWERCFIASAAFGSRSAPEVQRLRNFRDSVLGSHPIAWSVVERFFADYYRFSPAISVDMQRDHRLRELVRVVAAEPLLHFWTLCQIYVTGKSSVGDFVMKAIENLEQSSTDCAIILADANGSKHTLSKIRAIMQIDYLESPDGYLHRSEIMCGTSFDPQSPLSAFDRIARSMFSHAQYPEILSWALLQPLAIYWKFVVTRERDRSDIGALGRLLQKAIEEWIFGIPLPADLLPSRDDILRELRTWRGF